MPSRRLRRAAPFKATKDPTDQRGTTKRCDVCLGHTESGTSNTSNGNDQGLTVSDRWERRIAKTCPEEGKQVNIVWLGPMR